MAKQKKRVDWVKEAEDMGLEVQPEMTVPQVKKIINMQLPPTPDQQTLGEAMLNHPRCKEIRFFINMRTAKFRGGLTTDQKEEATKLLTELGLPVPK